MDAGVSSHPHEWGRLSGMGAALAYVGSIVGVLMITPFFNGMLPVVGPLPEWAAPHPQDNCPIHIAMVVEYRPLYRRGCFASFLVSRFFSSVKITSQAQDVIRYHGGKRSETSLIPLTRPKNTRVRYALSLHRSYTKMLWGRS